MSTPRERKLLDAAEAIRNAARELDMDFPRSALDDPMTPAMRRELIEVRQRDVASLNLGRQIVEFMLLNADGFSMLMTLAQKKRWAFDSCVEYAQRELAAEDSPIQQDKAA